MLESSTFEPERRQNASSAEEEEDYTIYNSSPMGYEAMLKIRDDCDKLIINYNASAEGNEARRPLEREVLSNRLNDHQTIPSSCVRPRSTDGPAGTPRPPAKPPSRRVPFSSRDSILGVSRSFKVE